MPFRQLPASDPSRTQAPTLRRRAREWGVFYAQCPGEPEEGSGETPTPAPAPPVA